MSFDVIAELDGRFWFVTIPGVGRSTQARNIAEIVPMAKDLIHLMVGEKDAELTLSFVLPARVQSHLDAVGAAREREAQARKDAALQLRQAARELRDLHLTLADVGAVLGVSHQRAHQLLSAASAQRGAT